MKTILHLAFLAVLLTFALPTHGQTDAPRPNPDAAELKKPTHFLVPQSILEPLNLSEDQKKQYESIEKEYLQERDKLHLDDNAVRKALAARRAAEQEGDPAKIESARKKLFAERETYRHQAEPMRQIYPDYLARFVRILSPEQAKQFDSAGKLGDPNKTGSRRTPPARN